MIMDYINGLNQSNNCQWISMDMINPNQTNLTGAFHVGNGWQWGNGITMNSYEMDHSLIPC